MRRRGPRGRALALIAAAWLAAACGGGGGGGDTGSPATPAPACDPVTEKSWLRSMMRDLYYWYAQAPDPEPAGFDSVATYFRALLHTAVDRWSYFTAAEADTAYYQEGIESGYGARFAWDAQRRLRVAWVERDAPLARAGLVRGLVVVTLNGRTPEAIAAAGEWGAVLYPPGLGVPLTLQVQDSGGGGVRSVQASSSLVMLRPANATILPAADGARVGYVLFNYHVATAAAPLTYVFETFRREGVADVVLDLRYNGGGFEYIANQLAALVAGASAAGQVFVSHHFNDRHPEKDFTSRFATVPDSAALGLRRVFVLTGGGTCSAAELIINSLKPFVEVVQIGATTCGKPYGMIRQANCGTAYYPIQLETRNARGEGGYTAGIAPTCSVADDFDHPLGNPAEARLAAALNYRTTGACPAPPVSTQQRYTRRLEVSPPPGPLPGFGVNIVSP